LLRCFFWSWHHSVIILRLFASSQRLAGHRFDKLSLIFMSTLVMTGIFGMRWSFIRFLLTILIWCLPGTYQRKYSYWTIPPFLRSDWLICQNGLMWNCTQSCLWDPNATSRENGDTRDEMSSEALQ
jgi:hypothetical protein